MEVAALTISIVSVFLAALLAAWGGYTQWLVSRDTREQLTQMSALLGEIRGLTTQTRESQERQFETMLHAVVDRTEDRTREATTLGTAGLIERIDAVETALREDREPSEVARELADLRNRVEALAIEIPNAVRRGGEAQAGALPSIEKLSVPRSVPQGASVRISAWCDCITYGREDALLDLVCGVAPPAGPPIEVTVPIRASGRTFQGFTYPDDFDGADSNAPGEYVVRTALQLPGATDSDLAHRYASFRVIPSEPASTKGRSSQ
jgi:hypothetical protein